MKNSTYFIEIDFQNPESGELFTLKWKIVDKDYAWIWVRELKRLMDRQEPLYARFTGFDTSEKEKQKVFNDLNKAIEIINAEGAYQIKEKGTGYFDQEFANIIHHHFEVLYGDAHNPSEIFRSSTPLVQSAISKLNHSVHDLESMHRNLESKDAFSAVIVEFWDRRQLKLTDDMLKDFSMDVEFGDLDLHYGIIGKTWWEVFLDEDEEVFLSGIRPLNVLSGEFDIHFGEQKVDEATRERFNEFLRKYEQNPADPKLALGHLNIGKLILEKGISRSLVKEEIAKHRHLAEVRLFQGDRPISQFSTWRGETTHEGFFRMREECVIEADGVIPVFHVPIQLVPIRGKEKGVTKVSNIPLQNIFQEKGHIISFMGTSDEHPVEFNPCEEFGGLRLKEKVILYKGDLLHLAYDLRGGYLPIKAGDIT